VTLGPLILAGGAEFDDRMAEADRVWLAAKGIFRPRLGLFPTANTERPDKAASNGVSHFRRLVTHSEAVMVTTRETAADPGIVEQIAKLDYAYFAGGNPTHLAETMAGSEAWVALVRAWEAGMGLGGSSAGAMVMCEAVYVQERWAAGLAVLPGAVVLPHFNRKDEASIERARKAVVGRGLAGIGVDESTALIWMAGEGWRVAGPGRVRLLTEAGAVTYGDGDSPEGVPDPSLPGPRSD
jgi:cyanophycinase